MTKLDILYVDDDKECIKGAEELFQKSPIAFQTAGTFERAVDILNRFSFKLGIFDWEFPRSDGEKVDRTSGQRLIEYALNTYPDMAIAVLSGRYREEIESRL